ncbi:hypothetical protein GS461_09750 [Rhodococcus hoagii]|nr:hypothetical protein [Prescottella equi]
MTHSFYLGPKKARFTPSSWDDIVTAAGDGLLDEGHWVELKKDLPPKGASANTELARDLASLSVDGGSFIIGIEDNKGQAGDVTGAKIDGLASRLDATAQARVDPPLAITIDTFKNPDDPEMGVLVVTVPASAGAPHMVDGSYWGRGDEGKRKLSNSEVRRLMDQRGRDDDAFRQKVDSVMEFIGMEPLKAGAGYLQLIAEPVAPPNGDSVFDVIGTSHPIQVFSNLIRWRLTWPGLKSLSYRLLHADGLGAASFGPQIPVDYDEFRVAFLIGESGTWRVASGSAVRPIGGIGDRQSGPTVFSGGAALELTHSSLAALADFATNVFPINSEWRIGVRVTGLQGIQAIEAHTDRMSGATFPPFAHAEFVKTTSASTQELVDEPGRVTERILRPLLRALGVDRRYFPYASIEDLANR